MITRLATAAFIYGAGGNTIGDERRQNHFFEFLEVMKKAWTEEEFSGFQGEFYEYPAFPSGASIMPKPVQKPHLPLDSQQSFVPMGRMGYRIAIGGGSSHNERGDAVLKGRRQELPPGVDRRGPPWRSTRLGVLPSASR